MKTPLPTCKRLLLLLCSWLLMAESTAQKSAEGISFSMADSLLADENNSFLNNNIVIRNENNRPAQLELKTTVPSGWRSLVPEIQRLTIAAGESFTTSVILVKEHNMLAEWNFVEITAIINNGEGVIKTGYHIKAPPFSNFKISGGNSKIYIQKNTGKISVPVKIGNRGNINEEYQLLYKNRMFNISGDIRLKLAPGKDTTYVYTARIPKGSWGNFNSENLTVQVSDKKTMYAAVYNLVKLSSVKKEHPSPYAGLPMELESGFVSTNAQSSYYFGISGKINYPDSARRSLSYYYRSKQLGLGRTLERNAFGINYSVKNWTIQLGEMGMNSLFFAYGQGGSFTKRFGKSKELTVATVIPFRNHIFRAYNYLAAFTYKINKMQVTHTASANYDRKNKVNGYVLATNVQIIKEENIRLSVNAGVGQNRFVQSNGKTVPDIKAGFAAGYIFTLRNEKGTLIVNSIAQQNSIYYPGIGMGLRNHFHNVTWQVVKHVDITAYYQSNRSINNIFRDTLYNTDALTLNTTRYGVGFNLNFGKFSTAISAGRLLQNSEVNSNLPKYRFLDFSSTLRTGKHFLFTVSSLNGYDPAFPAAKGAVKLWINNSSAVLSYRFAGIRCIYVRNPSSTLVANNLQMIETLNYSPFIRFNIRRVFNMNMQYTTSKTLLDNRTSTFLNGGFSYNNQKNGLFINLGYNHPVKNPNAGYFALTGDSWFLSIRKKLNVPLFTKKKFYNLKLRLFNDANNNGTKENNETPLADVVVNINETAFITDKEGYLRYNNIPSKKYGLDFTAAGSIKGLVPALGPNQEMEVKGNTVKDIAFKKSKIIFGKVTVKLDSLYRMNITPDNLKVTAVDSSGKVYSTLTNENGQFFINVPSGKFDVSLNPEAFNDNIKPVQLKFSIDMSLTEQAEVNFEVKQQSRKVRMLNMKN